MNGNRNLSTTYSWPLIIVLLIIFWPVGVYLLYKRINTDKTAILKNSKTVFIISLVLIGIAVLYLLEGLTGNLKSTDGSSVVSGMIIVTLLFGGGGIYLLFVSKRMKSDGEKYKKYIGCIINQHLTSLDTLASVMNTSYEAVTKDLQKMIRLGYFSGSYIDEQKREFVLPVVQAPQQSVQTKVVTCSGCGAQNTVAVGQVSECEYCGSHLQ